jgi:hypothetical protein
VPGAAHVRCRAAQPILCSLKQILSVEGMADSALSPLCVLLYFPPTPLTYVNQPKAFLSSESYIIANVHVNVLARQLEGDVENRFRGNLNSLREIWRGGFPWLRYKTCCLRDWTETHNAIVRDVSPTLNDYSPRKEMPQDVNTLLGRLC